MKTKTITLLRHAKSDAGNARVSDQERGLSRRGMKDVPEMAARMLAANIRPSLILSSPAVRAWETAKIVATDLGYPGEFLQRETSLYLASKNELLRIIAAQDDGFNHLMIVGHNPGLSDLAEELAPGQSLNIPTCGLVTIELDTENWALTASCDSRLLVFDYPKRDLDDSMD